MDEILFRYQQSDIEFNYELGIVVLNKPIPVKDFLELKYLLGKTNYRINDIRVSHIRAYF